MKGMEKKSTKVWRWIFYLPWMKRQLVILILLVPVLLSACSTDDSTPSAVIPTASSTEVFRGEYGIASDPSVIKDGNTYRMSYTGFDPVTQRTVICVATSLDGLAWTNVPVDGGAAGQVVGGTSDSWQERLEGSCLLPVLDVYHLYYSGYRDQGSPASGFPAALGLATSTDGIHFTKRKDPILAPTDGWYDNDAIYSPSIVRVGDKFFMVYTGHCYTNCQQEAGVFLLYATSRDGIHWEKHPEPVRFTNQPDWSRHGVAEVSVLLDQGDSVRLFVTGRLGDGEQQVIGQASSSSFYGPYTLAEQPLITPSLGTFNEIGALAPSVLAETQGIRMWYFGLNKEGRYAIGHATGGF